MLLDVRDVRKSYAGAAGPVPVLQGISLTLGGGETLALTGESGSGKSTLLHLIGGLDAPDDGTIEVDGTALAGLGEAGRARFRRETVGIVFQQFNLIPSLSVADNIAFQARLAGRYDPARATELAEALGIAAQRDQYPETLSGGQQQRVAIARALAARPRLLLADEPTGNLDEASAGDVLDLMLDLVTATGVSLLVVTHSDQVAARMGRRVRLSGGRISEAAA
ncbi:ABC transporter ATP-binding protein [Ponticoccus sp. SC2-23]|uniref:ABC transporter ATP-binding protein n=1 Tax=Alexandriicola marinus TaxID=2081710 RepID=UPI000FDC5507|nr:ABC transporter ATP-binding protein [Alexandriicola marinus]MBM1219922.1 ABC transporter ATP-binding protein [Ponticoccus sp. SC6-9]MBM1224608.1 ABC transporter ATP-binding protein [Ponticoccus sp. SC6-15]MBM1228121.1 ABC transporter ATP-binding protein [Ponticoccus sp. SC6-38]MBM1234241.1 ABC transporter ATP-binding protein [Ponticoccus sp. SC6-45]MBM1238623.1 ABC transporter ATP-binding protein [Ponticoccus sp. SC6-49]MBM1242404.1 ABC transporter ATP-binding protein [Ponticoccus sp. SC2-